MPLPEAQAIANGARHAREDRRQTMQILRFGTAACDSTSASRGFAAGYTRTHHVPHENGALAIQDME